MREYLQTPDQHAYWETIDNQRPPDHPVCTIFSQQRWQFVQQAIDWQEISSVLDLGCGRGMAVAALEDDEYQLTGVDFSLHQLRANPVSRMDKVVARGEGLPFAHASFDLITCWEVLHHAPSPLDMISEMTRLSKQWIVIFEPNIWNPAQLLFSLLVPEERGSLSLHKRDIDQALTQNGFDIVLFRRVGWIFPNRFPLWLVRLLHHIPFVLPRFGISRVWIARKVLR